MIPRPGVTDQRPVSERMESRIGVPLKSALYAAENLLGPGARIAKALASVKRELEKEISERRVPLKAARRTKE